ncbi:MAG TPA: hypothetical protein VJN18_29585 [Polyangiaceae bacterium]|nr:hypothetical protein [Polyangiaceae bacterium]
MSRGPRVAAVCAAVLVGTLASLASAKPRWSSGLETAICGTGSSFGFSELGWCNALRADLLLLRERGSDFGIGPALRVGSAGFDDFRFDAGLSVLLPLLESFPLVLEAGPHLRNLDQPGVFGSAFFGLRSFNHYGHYDMSTGIVVIAQRSFTTGTRSALWLGARIDGYLFALPFVLAYNALR